LCLQPWYYGYVNNFKNTKNMRRRLLSLFYLGLFSIGLLLNLSPPKAAAISETNIGAQASFWNAAENLRTFVSLSVQGGNTGLNGSSANTDSLRGGLANSSLISVASTIASARKTYFTSNDLLAQLGYTQSADGNWRTTDGPNALHQLEVLVGDKGITKNLPWGNFGSGTGIAPLHVQYYDLYQSFLQCGPKLPDQIFSRPGTQDNGASQGEPLWLYNPATKEVRQYIVATDTTLDPDRRFVGRGANLGESHVIQDQQNIDTSGKLIGSTDGGGRDDTLDSITCGRAKELLKYGQGLAQAYADAVAATDPSPDATLSSTGTSVGDAASAPQIDCGSGFNPLNWVVCPAIFGLNKITGIMDTIITQNISAGSSNGSSDPSNLFGANTTGDAYHSAWASFRTLALSLLVIAALVVIISEALGFEILSAYAIRKVLPRIFIAAIVIALSWNLMQFFVTFTNDLGHGVRSIIYTPFSQIPGAGALKLGDGGANIAVKVSTDAAILSLGIFGLLSFVATGALAIFTTFLVLIIRQVVIAALVIIAPVAILMFVLPNTNNLFKLWLNSFARGLLMFPIIAAFLASGRAFSAVASTQPGAFAKYIAFAAYFAPYFLIPMTFKLAGGAMGAVGGAINNRSKAYAGGLAKFRGGRRKKVMANTAARTRSGDLVKGTRFLPGSQRVASRVSRRAAGLTTGTKGHFGFGARGAAAMAIADGARVDDTLRNDANLREIANMDPANAVLANSGGTLEGAREAARDLFTKESGEYDSVGANKALAAARAVGINRSNAQAAYKTMMQNKARAVKQGDVQTLQRGIARLAGGGTDASGSINTVAAENLEHSTTFFGRSGGRGDLGGDWNSDKVQAMASVIQSKSPGTVSAQEALRQAVSMDGMGRTEVPDLLRGFTSGQMTQYTKTLENLYNSNDDGLREMAATRLLELQKNINYASGDNQGLINESLDRVIDMSDTVNGVDQQLASGGRAGRGLSTRDSQGNVGVLSGALLSRKARVYDQQNSMDPGAPGRSQPTPPQDGHG
jgi:hypothetical protein